MSINILIAEDDPALRRSLAKALTSRGYQIEEAASGPEAIHKIRNQAFRLVLADLYMPDIQGIEILEKAKQKNPDTQVILMTGVGTVGYAVESMKKGACDFIQKPFEWDTLMACIDRALDRSDLQHMIAVYQASQCVSRSSRLDILLPAMSKLCRRFLRADDVVISLYNDRNQLELAGDTILDSTSCRHQCVSFAQKVIEESGSESEPILLRDVSRDPRVRDIPCVSQIYSSIIYPLVQQGQVLGALQLNRTQSEEPFTTFDLRCVSIFSTQIAQAVYNARLYKELEEKVSQLEIAKKTIEDAQQKLIQSEKMAAMGTLAAGVAHELNNPVTGILGYTQLLLDEKSLTAQQREDLQTIETQSRRCRTIIQNLLDFGRVKKPSMSAVDIIPLIKSTLHLVAYDFSTSGVELIEKYPESLPKIVGDSHQMQQVLLNLLTNARHAMEGQLRKRLTIQAGESSGRLYVHIKDTGCGISADLQKKIFDPFFTTKPAGQGTGLGLSICQSIVEQHNGLLRVKSKPQKGSVFTLEFPISRDEVSHAH